jgi:hypothetical protein
MHYKDLKSKVQYCLEKYVEARNSDVKLCNYLLLEFYKEYLNYEGISPYIYLKDLYNVPKFENICRLRRKFNEKKMFLATDPFIIKERRKRERDWRYEMSPSNPARG